MAEPQIGEVIKDITADVQTIIKGEIELAKAEMMPQVKRAGIGAGMFGAAGYFAIQAATLLFICGGLALSALYQGVVPIIWAFTLGFLTMAVILLVVAGILVLIGKNKVKVSAPERTIAEANRSIEAVTGAVDQANANVRAIVAGAPRTTPEVRP
ncbi:phage holin family protein [Propioniciclava sp. MC1683]|uniref:phage holin family protein n=1 Tax=Propioniciclava sp. MC1683 TaxID=2760309 RepID=UPI0016007758|nr:phage holin family protein [Propioniciclava sp. MC1683]MBB1501770.1 phage holin family protein [Propioniciclava sp. MC1683]